ncbi:unnamed protein product [Urochloa humidicola]
MRRPARSRKDGSLEQLAVTGHGGRRGRGGAARGAAQWPNERRAVHASSAVDEVAWCAVGRGRATEVRRQPGLLLRAPVLLPPHREALRGPRSPSASCSSMAATESNPKRSLNDLELGGALGWAQWRSQDSVVGCIFISQSSSIGI